MPEIMPFGRMRDLSVEQIALKDYKYFTYILKNIPIKKRSLSERFDFVEHVVNNFRSSVSCSGCDNDARLLSVYYDPYTGQRGSDSYFIYCSRDCWSEDSMVSQSHTSLVPLRFRSTISDTKFDTNALVEIIAGCMGLKSGRRSKEYLEDFFNGVELVRPFR